MSGSGPIYPFDGNAIISASAGTGKTYTLVDLYLKLVTGQADSSGTPISPGRILTITFTQKAAAEMRTRIRNQLGKSPKFKADKITYSQLEIKTFHGFCHRLLREHSLDLGLAPSSSVLDEYESNKMLKEIVDQLILHQLAEGNCQGLALTYGFSSRNSRANTLNNLLFEGYKRFRQLGIPLPSGRRITLNTFNRLLQHPSPTPSELIKQTLSFVQDVSQIKPTKTIHSFLECWSEQGSLFRDLKQSETDEWFDCLQTIFTELAKLRKKEIKSLHAELVSAYKSFIDRHYLAMSKPSTENFFDLLELVDKKYYQEKKDRDRIDYEDQISLAVKLLQDNPPVLEHYRETFKVIMVDEFQDTNQAQRDLIDLLHGTGNRLFVVGDPKQSIYRFRGSDVSIFSEVKAEITANGGRQGVLKNSYRSCPELLTFFNEFFAEQAVPKSPFAFQYGSHDFLSPSGKTLEQKKTGGAELIEISENHQADRFRLKEAEIIARKIEELTAPPRDKQTGAVNFKDIAVLFQSLKQVEIYERALREKRIPCYLQGSRNLFKRREILDIYHLLSCLNSPSDTFHLYGVLKSFIVGISDETALYLKKENFMNIFPWKADQEFPRKISSEDKRKLAHFSILDHYLRERLDSLTGAEIIEKTLAGSGYGAFLMGSQGGEQRLANLQVLIELSRDFESRVEHDWRSFSDHLGYLIKTGTDSQEAQLEKENVVSLMTIHQAKGLEFPVVFLADLIRKPTPGRRIPLDEKIGLGLKAFPSMIAEGQETPVTEKIKASIKEKERAERMRLLYVAMTRAERYLVFVSQPKPPRNCWMELIVNFAEKFPESIARSSEDDLTATHDHQTTSSPNKGIEPDEAEIISQSYHYRPQPTFDATFPVTGISDFVQCQYRYFLTHVLGIADNFPANQRKNGFDDLKSPALLGEITHNILERIDFRSPRRENKAFDLLGGLKDKERSQVESAIRDFLNSELGEAVKKAAAVYREHPFSFTLKAPPHTFTIKGKIDLLFFREDHWIIVDYKYASGKSSPPAGYRTQLQIYDFALSLQFPGSNRKAYLQYLKPPLSVNEIALTGPDCFSSEARITETVLEICHKKRQKGDWKKKNISFCSAENCPYRFTCHQNPQ